MNLSFWKTTLREIRQSFGRFAAILSIIALGVGFFAGLKTTRPSMIHTCNEYVKESNMFDYRLISTLGYDDNSVKLFSDIEGVEYVSGAYNADFVTDMEGKENIVVRAHSITENINNLRLVAGRMPESADECLLDGKWNGEDCIGTVLSLERNDDEVTDKFRYKEYKVVGLVHSVSYLNYERGTTSLGGGAISDFVYLLPEGFDMEQYTEVYLTLKDKADITTKEYENLIDDNRDIMETAARTAADMRHDDIVSDALSELYDAKAELKDARTELADKKADGAKELNDAKKELEDALKQLEKGYSEALDGKKLIDDKRKEIDDKKKLLDSSYSDYLSSKDSFLEGLDVQQGELTDKLAIVNQGIAAFPEGYEGEEKNALLMQKQALTDAIDKIVDGRIQANIAYEEAEKTFADQYAAINEGYAVLNAEEEKLNEGLSELYKGEADYNKGMEEYNDALKEYDEKIADAEKEIEKAEKEIKDAEADINDIPTPSIFTLTRFDNVGYVCFENDSNIVEGISKIFPIFFFLVAALVCVTTMDRMVDEQRTHIGTLKALGFSKSVVALKYIVYSGLAAVSGCLLGFFGGCWLFPTAIWSTYGIMYGFGKISIVLNLPLFIISLAAALVCSVGSAYISCRKELRDAPAFLMRPKPPKTGRRVLIERIDFIWKRLNFIKKVAYRNIFRYQKRLIMMLVGIGGCMALLLTGFGLHDSIANIINDQYTVIEKQDGAVTFSESRTLPQRRIFEKEFSDVVSDTVFLKQSSMDILFEDKLKTINLISFEDESRAEDFINLHTTAGEKIAYPQKGGAVISHKIASRLGIKEGDTVTLRDGDLNEYSFRIDAIFENYVYSYIFVNSADVPDISCRSAYVKFIGDDAHEAAAELMGGDDVVSVSVNADLQKRFGEIIKSLDYVVALVIACAAALAFIVLYNLTNINITERIREIATIKVLGFYPMETAQYVFRENIILTFMGAVVGVPLGYLLHSYVMGNIDIEAVAFPVHIFPISLLYSFVLTVLFTLMVNFVLYFKLKKIDMTGSLKSVE